MDENQRLINLENESRNAIAAVVSLWADHVTDPSSPRRFDLLRDKSTAILDFLAFIEKAPDQATPLDVKQWQADLEDQGLAPATVYARISRVSSFYNWAIDNDQLQHNPVDLARPKAPQAYQTEKTQALADLDVQLLLDIVRARANDNNIVAKRDYALLLFYLTTGMRRREVIQLRWGDLRIGDGLVLTTEVKGGEYLSREVREPQVKESLLAYLQASGRLAEMEADSPLWTAHDRSGQHTGKPLTSHGFVKNLKKYARLAGIGAIHLHQTRHTYARIVAEETGSIIETQDALGHKNAATTKVYVQRIAVKKDKHSRQVAARFGLSGDDDNE